jgi:hypothetical protein
MPRRPNADMRRRKLIARAQTLESQGIKFAPDAAAALAKLRTKTRRHVDHRSRMETPPPSPLAEPELMQSLRRQEKAGKPLGVSFYSSEEWARLRYETLKKSDGQCECCGARGNEGRVLVVDHIVPLSKDWSRRLDPTNLQVLCRRCNWGKGGRDWTDWRPTGG